MPQRQAVTESIHVKPGTGAEAYHDIIDMKRQCFGTCVRTQWYIHPTQAVGDKTRPRCQVAARVRRYRGHNHSPPPQLRPTPQNKINTTRRAKATRGIHRYVWLSHGIPLFHQTRDERTAKYFLFNVPDLPVQLLLVCSFTFVLHTTRCHTCLSCPSVQFIVRVWAFFSTHCTLLDSTNPRSNSKIKQGKNPPPG